MREPEREREEGERERTTEEEGEGLTVAGCAREEHDGGEGAQLMVFAHGEVTGRCFSRCMGGGVPEEGVQVVAWVRR